MISALPSPPEAFDERVHQLQRWLVEHQRLFRRLEGPLPPGELERPEVQSAWIHELRQGFAPAFASQIAAIDAARRRSTAPEDALCARSRQALQGLLLGAPFMHRTFHKPLGYAGDYLMMRYLYDLRLEGQTLYDRAVHFAVTELPAGRAVFHRKELLRDMLAAALRARHTPLRVASVASGPAQEVVELLEGAALPCPLELTLLDQDGEALEAARRRIEPLARRSGLAEVRYVREPVKRLIKDPDFAEELGRFDRIYSAGLFDYLPRPAALALLRRLVGMLSQGGALYVGNFAPEQPTRWLMEQHMDWWLIHRSREEMEALGQEAGGGLPQRVIAERLGINLFLVLGGEG